MQSASVISVSIRCLSGKLWLGPEERTRSTSVADLRKEISDIVSSSLSPSLPNAGIALLYNSLQLQDSQNLDLDPHASSIELIAVHVAFAYSAATDENVVEASCLEAQRFANGIVVLGSVHTFSASNMDWRVPSCRSSVSSQHVAESVSCGGVGVNLVDHSLTALKVKRSGPGSASSSPPPRAEDSLKHAGPHNSATSKKGTTSSICSGKSSAPIATEPIANASSKDTTKDIASNGTNSTGKTSTSTTKCTVPSGTKSIDKTVPTVTVRSIFYALGTKPTAEKCTGISDFELALFGAYVRDKRVPATIWWNFLRLWDASIGFINIIFFQTDQLLRYHMLKELRDKLKLSRPEIRILLRTSTPTELKEKIRIYGPGERESAMMEWGLSPLRHPLLCDPAETMSWVRILSVMLRRIKPHELSLQAWGSAMLDVVDFVFQLMAARLFLARTEWRGFIEGLFKLLALVGEALGWLSGWHSLEWPFSSFSFTQLPYPPLVPGTTDATMLGRARPTPTLMEDPKFAAVPAAQGSLFIQRAAAEYHNVSLTLMRFRYSEELTFGHRSNAFFGFNPSLTSHDPIALGDVTIETTNSCSARHTIQHVLLWALLAVLLWQLMYTVCQFIMLLCAMRRGAKRNRELRELRSVAQRQKQTEEKQNFDVMSCKPHVGNSTSASQRLAKDAVENSEPLRLVESLKGNGLAVDWGSVAWRGEANANTFHWAFTTERACTALRASGGAGEWVPEDYNGIPSHAINQHGLGVKAFFGTSRYFAALQANGEVLTWSKAYMWGNPSTVASQLDGGATMISSALQALEALGDPGRVAHAQCSTTSDSEGARSEPAFFLFIWCLA